MILFVSRDGYCLRVLVDFDNTIACTVKALRVGYLSRKQARVENRLKTTLKSSVTD